MKIGIVLKVQMRENEPI